MTIFQSRFTTLRGHPSQLPLGAKPPPKVGHPRGRVHSQGRGARCLIRELADLTGGSCYCFQVLSCTEEKLVLSSLLVSSRSYSVDLLGMGEG